MLRHIITRLSCLLLLLAPCSYSDTVYKTVDEHGNVVFSDVPSDDSKQVEVEIQNIQEATRVTTPTRQAPVQPKVETRISLLSPAEGQRFGPSQRNLTISVQVHPTLPSGHRIAFYIDGKRIAEPSRSTSTSIPMGLKMRGRHSVQAKLLNKAGATVSTTPSVSIYTIRPN